METPRVTSVTVIPPYTLEVSFKDGFSRRVDMTHELWGKVFEPLKDEKLFAQAFVDPVSRTVAWPNGADLAPEWLYEPDPVKWQQLVEESRAREAAQRQKKKARKKQDARI
jgi:hypothetical protein